jgi:protein phosphatase
VTNPESVGISERVGDKPPNLPTAIRAFPGDPSDERSGIWASMRMVEALTAKGGEGMVVKPLDFVARGPKGLGQATLSVAAAG